MPANGCEAAVETMNILVCLNENYLPPLRVMLKSLYINNPGEAVAVWLLHRGIPAAELESLAYFCKAHGSKFYPIAVDDSLFCGAPAAKRYPQEMYYRLLAPQLLPPQMDRALYLDPDTLVINPLRPLYEMEMRGNLFAAAPHTGKTEFANEMNKVRLGTNHAYYNSGVLLVDLACGRKEVSHNRVSCYVREHGKALLLPDQDVLNGLYGKQTLELDDAVWNYDARNYSSYLLRSGGRADVDWVMQNTAILHFCGGAKPWKPGYSYRFGLLYKHYMQLAKQQIAT